MWTARVRARVDDRARYPVAAPPRRARGEPAVQAASPGEYIGYLSTAAAGTRRVGVPFPVVAVLPKWVGGGEHITGSVMAAPFALGGLCPPPSACPDNNEKRGTGGFFLIFFIHASTRRARRCGAISSPSPYHALPRPSFPPPPPLWIHHGSPGSSSRAPASPAPAVSCPTVHMRDVRLLLYTRFLNTTEERSRWASNCEEYAMCTKRYHMIGARGRVGGVGGPRVAATMSCCGYFHAAAKEGAGWVESGGNSAVAVVVTAVRVAAAVVVFV